MTTITWTGAAGDGKYSTAGNWSPAQVPTTSDSVVIKAGVGTIDASNDAAGTMNLGKNDVLAVGNNTDFTIGGATPANAGFVNQGTLALNSGGNGTDLVISAKTVTLSGTGTIALSDNGANRIYGASGSDILNNTSNTIIGAGQLGAGQLTIVNGAAGKIIASGGNALVLNTGGAVTTNSGLIEALSGAGLVVNSVINNGSLGTISAAGADVQLQGGTIRGGTLTTTGTSTIMDNGGGTLDGSASMLVNAGTVAIANNQVLGILGTIDNLGVISMRSGGNGTDLVLQSSTVTLKGGGTIALSDNGGNRIYGASGTYVLDNLDNTILGAGQLGLGQLTLVNEASGRILSTGGNALIINTVGAASNAGLIEAQSGGGIVLNSAIDNGASGLIIAAGGNFQLQGGTIRGGTLETSNGGAILDNGGGTLDGSTNAVVNDGTVNLANNQVLDLDGRITNAGLLNLQSGGNSTDLVVQSSTVTLNGGGTIALSDNGGNRIYGASSTNVLDNVDNLIVGAGEIGAGQLTLVNHATIDASGGNQLRIDPGNVVINDGLMEATGTGGLWIQGNSTIDGSGGGTLFGNGGNVELSGAVIAGGTLQTAGGGAIVDAGGATLDGTTQTVVNRGTLLVQNNQTLTVVRRLSNAGTISLQSGGNTTDLVMSSPSVTLNGGGTIVLSDSGANRIYGANGATVLENVNNTIEGAGQLGAAQLTLVNDAGGRIIANGSNTLIINTGGATTTNAGLIEALAGGGIVLNSRVDNGTAGIIKAAGGNVQLQGGTIAGGTLASSGGGSILDSGGGALDGSVHQVVNNATVTVQNNQTLRLYGTIFNTGTIGLQSGGNTTDAIASSPTLTLKGGGTIALNDNPANRFYGASVGTVLNNVNNTIEGAGQLGLGELTIVNGGTIAQVGGNELRVDPGSTVRNTGAMIASGSGGLNLTDGTYTNPGLFAVFDGSHLGFAGNATLTNNKGGVLTGGTYEAVSTGDGATLELAGAAIRNDSATITLDGAGSTITAGTLALEASLTSIGALGVLQLLDGRGFTATHVLTDRGTISLAGGTLGATQLVIDASGELSATGTIAAHVADSGTIDIPTLNAGSLTLLKGGTVAGAVNGGTLVLAGGATTLESGTTLNLADIAMISRSILNVAAPISFLGTLDFAGTNSVQGTGTYANGGLIEQTGTATTNFGVAVNNAGGTIDVASGGLTFAQGITGAGLIIDDRKLSVSSNLTGGTLDIGPAGSVAQIATASGAGNSTLAVLDKGAGTLDTNGTTVTVTSDYNNTAAGSGNTYNPFKGVTGTINGQGTQMAIIGVNGTTISTVNGTPTILLAPGESAHFEVENTGAAGSAALRGALQTSVDGGNITSSALSGTGIKAGNFGPIAAGASSNVYTIHYSGGVLADQSIHFESDFANVAGITLDIQRSAAAAAPPAALPDAASGSAMDWFVTQNN